MKVNDDTLLDVVLMFNGGPPGAVKQVCIEILY